MGMPDGDIRRRFKRTASGFYVPEMVHECAIMGVSYPLGIDENALEEILAGTRELGHRGGQGWGLGGINPGRDTKFQLARTDRFKIAAIDYLRKRRDVGPIIEAMLEGLYFPVGLGHARYATSGPRNGGGLQPGANDPEGKWNLARQQIIAWNGNIVNTRELREFLESKKFTYEEGEDTVDTQLLSDLLTWIDQNRHGGAYSGREANYEEMLIELDTALDGACSLLLVDGLGNLVGYRGRKGIRPAHRLLTPDGRFYLGSETVALNQFGDDERIFDIEPGQMAWKKRSEKEPYIATISGGKRFHNAIKAPDKEPAFCIFEYFYFESILSREGDVFIRDIRNNLGNDLGQQVKKIADRLDERYKKNLVIAAVPKSGLGFVQGFADGAGLSEYCGKTEVMKANDRADRAFTSLDEDRQETLRKKYTFFNNQIRGKIIWLVDDTLVRGDTLSYVVGELKRRGALQVHVFIPSPPIKNPCCLGIDMSTNAKMAYWKAIGQLAYKKRKAAFDGAEPDDVFEKIAEDVGADSVTYTRLDRVRHVVRATTKKKAGFCDMCLGGAAPTKGSKEFVKTERRKLERHLGLH